MIWGLFVFTGVRTARSLPLFLIFCFLSPLVIWISYFILHNEFVRDPETQKPSSQPEKPKNAAADSISTRDLLAILSDDDLDDLRAEAREVLRARIQRIDNDDSEEVSFDELLATPERRKRR